MKMKISMPGIERQLSVSSHLPNELTRLTFAVVITKLPRADSDGRGLRCVSAAARLLRSRVRMALRAWMFVCCVLCG